MIGLNNKRYCISVKRGPKEDIKGLGKKLEVPFKRRDAVLAHCQSVENTGVQGSAAGRVVCQFNLSEGMCHVKHESGLEVPHPCETLLNCWDDQVSVNFVWASLSLSKSGGLRLL